MKSAVRCLDCYQQGFLFLDLAHPDSWLILYASPEAVKQTGKPAASRRLITRCLACAGMTPAGVVMAGCSSPHNKHTGLDCG